jgi:phage shock protein PspC (stress-responsive transcriptional regulator)
MVKLFRRSKENRVIAGLCAGFGEYTETDPVFWRVLTVLLTIFSCSVFFWAYIIAWIMVPKAE